MKRLIIILFISIVIASYGFTYFEDTGSSRVLGLGGSSISVPGYSDTIQINPALSWYLTNHSVYMSYKKDYTGLDNDSFHNMFISYGYNFMGYFAVGVYDSFFTTDYYQENTLGIAFSRNIYEYITIGATTNIYSKKYKKNHYIDDDPFIIENGYSKTAFGLDIGTVFHPIENLNIGFVFRDINAPSIALGEGEDSIPRSLVVGSSYNYIHSDAFSIRPTFDFEYILENINSGNQVMYYMGGESWFLDKSIAVRGGYSKNKISFGTGVDFRNLGLKMGSFDIILDYTFNIYTGSLSEGGYAYNMGLIFEFGGEKEKVQ